MEVNMKEETKKSDKLSSDERSKNNSSAISSDLLLTKSLVDILYHEHKEADLSRKNEKLKRIILLLAKGVTLATVMATPKTAPVFANFLRSNSDWNEWKVFNVHYLRNTLKKLEKQKMVEVVNEGKHEVVKITNNGRKKILKFAVESIHVVKPLHWDRKWRLVFYDVLGGKRTIRDKFRSYLK